MMAEDIPHTDQPQPEQTLTKRKEIEQRQTEISRLQTAQGLAYFQKEWTPRFQWGAVEQGALPPDETPKPGKRVFTKLGPYPQRTESDLAQFLEALLGRKPTRAELAVCALHAEMSGTGSPP